MGYAWVIALNVPVFLDEISLGDAAQAPGQSLDVVPAAHLCRRDLPFTGSPELT